MFYNNFACDLFRLPQHRRKMAELILVEMQSIAVLTLHIFHLTAYASSFKKHCCGGASCHRDILINGFASNPKIFATVSKMKPKEITEESESEIVE